MSSSKEKFVTLGKFGAPYGLAGFIKITSYTDPTDQLLKYKPIFIRTKNNLEELVLADSRLFKNGKIIVKLDSYNSPEEVRVLTGLELVVARDSFPDLEENSYYWHDLCGLQVISDAGVVMGKVDYLFNSGASDIIVVKGDNKSEILLPYIDSVVKEVDLDAGHIIVTWDLQSTE